MVYRSFGAFAIFLLAGFAFAKPESHQRYVGTFSNSITKMQHLAKLDLIPTQKNEQLAYTAFLTLYLGDFSGKEYVTYHFDSGVFDLETSRIIFDQEDQAVSFITKKEAGDILKGELRTSVAGKVGELEFSRSNIAKIQKPLSPQLSGEYRGKCGDKDTTLQIQTMRSIDDTVRVGNPFGAYLIKAQWAEPFTREGCYGVNSPCVKYTYDNGVYNFFTGELGLYGRVKNLKCSVTSGQISCNSCVLKPRSQAFAKREYTFPTSKPFWSNSEDELEEVAKQDEPFQGEYKGILHHEFLNVYQNITLDIVDFPKTEDRKRNLIISAVAKLYFGEFSSSETIYYKFKQARFNPTRNTIFLENMERDTDAFLILEESSDGEIKGSWFSILFGRVGSFIVSKSTLPSPDEPIDFLDKISGEYKGQKWNLNITIARESTPLNTQNPFFPLNFKGFTYLKNIVDYNPIEGGSYDFYTGKIGLLLKDGSSFFGDRKSNKVFSLKRPSPGVLRPLINNDLLDYKRGDE